MNYSELAYFGGEPTVKKIKPHLEWPYLSDNCINEVTQYLKDRKPLSIADGSGVVFELEQVIKDYFGIDYVLTTNSGSNALHSAYVALNLKVGSEVIVPVSTFHASITPAIHCGLTPVLVDVSSETGNISPSAILEAITEKTSCIVVTHMFGHPVDLNEIVEICNRHGLKLIEDCSHSFGSTYFDRKVGTFGDVAVFSMQATKTVPAGEGGFLITSDRDIYERACLLGHYRGRSARDVQDPFLKQFAETGYGLKYRIHPLAAVIAKNEFLQLEKRISERNRITSVISQGLEESNGIIPPIIKEYVTMGGFFGYRARYIENKLFINDRPISVDEYIGILQSEGLEVHRPSVPPLDQMPIFRHNYVGLEYANHWKPRLLEPYLGAREFYKNLISIPSFMSLDSLPLINEYIKAIKKVSNILSPVTLQYKVGQHTHGLNDERPR
ncbi:AtaP4 protein [Paenibacillus algicola]|uniref:AtaP4 protein n=1 Tax=Paenibacillus algicola TaxID=2565926 RepID=A0A4P8XMC5_9BACL|nr:DegT/DnrJ/EryC1/StrS family aminotransferase [Paenibacillus algicola]QCT01399.1 AtaP4 protein [Paenibacillus algicola]